MPLSKALKVVLDGRKTASIGKRDEFDYGMEFRILNRITLHLDHAENFVRYDIQKMKSYDRHDFILPFKHNRVELNH